MFYYYGAKHRLAKRYPEPAYSVIVEPFAGAAGYSMFWLERDKSARAILVEKDPRVAATWTRLLQMSPDEIATIPIPVAGERSADFLIMTAAASNATATLRAMRVSKRSHGEIARMLRRMARVREAIGDRVSVITGDYTLAPNDDPYTWFIDPPYQTTRVAGKTPRGGGMGYAHGCRSSEIDYGALAKWCRSRAGQVIVSEYLTSDWLPFSPLAINQDANGRQYPEGLWVSG